MQFRLIHLFALLAIVAISLWETTGVVEIDASYAFPLKVVWPEGEKISLEYVLLTEDETFEILAVDPKDIPNACEVSRQLKTIKIPKTNLYSPLLRRRLGTHEPFDKIAFITGDGTKYYDDKSAW